MKDINQDYGLPPGDVKYFKSVVEVVKELLETNALPDNRVLEFFFNNALLPYYCPMYTGLKAEVGHLIYRLSDRVPKDVRKRIPLYPSDEGSFIIMDDAFKEIGPDNTDTGFMTRWGTLEGFREEWERRHLYIPPLQKALPCVEYAERLIDASAQTPAKA